MAGISQTFVYMLMLAMVLSGATLGIILKLQNSVTVDGDSFNHPYFQWLQMFVGESLWIFIYLFEKAYLRKTYGSVEASPGMQKAVAEGMKTKIFPLLLGIPMLWDATASTLLLIAYINIPASIAQMLSGLVVFIVAILSMIFLKRRFYRHHWTGLFLIFAGIWLVATAALTEQGGADSSGNAVLGVAMMIGSDLVQGFQYIIEEKLLGSYYLSPMKVVGWEGMTGTILFAILLPIFQYIPCTTNGIWSNGKVEDTQQAFSMIGKSAPLIIYIVLTVFCIAGLNGFGMAVTKYASSANRVTIQQTKTVLVWLFFLIYQGEGHENFKILQLVGFVLIVIGVILYNEIVEIPILGFNENTRSAIAKRKILEQEEDGVSNNENAPLVNDSTTYAQNSPKAYDTQRKYNRLKNHLEHKATEGENGDIKAEGLD